VSGVDIGANTYLWDNEAALCGAARGEGLIAAVLCLFQPARPEPGRLLGPHACRL